MPDGANNNNRVPLREYLEMRFDTLEQKFDDGFGDHETRLRRLENERPVRTLSEIGAGILSVIALAWANWRK